MFSTTVSAILKHNLVIQLSEVVNTVLSSAPWSSKNNQVWPRVLKLSVKMQIRCFLKLGVNWNLYKKVKMDLSVSVFLAPILPLCLHWEAEWWCLLTVLTLDLALKEGHVTPTCPLGQRNLVKRRQGVRPDTSHPAWRVLCTEEGGKVGFLTCVGKKIVLH